MTSKVEVRQAIEALCAKHGVSVPDGLAAMKFEPLQVELQRLRLELEPGEGGQPPGLTKVTPPPADSGGAQPPAGDPPPPDDPAGLAGAAGGSATGDGAPPSSVPPAAPAAPALPPPAATGTVRIWRVAQGKSVTTKKGQVDGPPLPTRGQEDRPRRIGAYGEVKLKDLGDDQQLLDSLVEQGVLVPYR